MDNAWNVNLLANLVGIMNLIVLLVILVIMKLNFLIFVINAVQRIVKIVKLLQIIYVPNVFKTIFFQVQIYAKNVVRNVSVLVMNIMIGIIINVKNAMRTANNVKYHHIFVQSVQQQDFWIQKEISA